jgi:hypothetical protein
VGYAAGDSWRRGDRQQPPQRDASGTPVDHDDDDAELVAYPLPTLDMRASQPPSPLPGGDLASMFPATAAALARQAQPSLNPAGFTGTLRSPQATRDDTQRTSYAAFGAMPTPRAGAAVQDAADAAAASESGQGPAWPPLMPSPDPALDVPTRKQMPRVLRPENLQALRDSATGLARSSIEAVREVEELVVRLTLLQQHLARRRTADATSQPQQVPGTVRADAQSGMDFVDGVEEEDGDELFELPLLHELG